MNYSYVNAWDRSHTSQSETVNAAFNAEPIVEEILIQLQGNKLDYDSGLMMLIFTLLNSTIRIRRFSFINSWRVEIG